MDNSGDYISREAAREAVWQILNGMGYSEKHNNKLVEEIDAVFDDIYAADVVEVVRCRECEHGEYDDAIEDEYCYHCRYDGFSYNKADHFCSDGERKGGDE